MRKMQYKHKLIIPAVITMLVVLIFPLIFSFGTSLTLYRLNRPDLQSFFWLNNYKEVLSDPRTLSTLWVTVKFSLMAVTAEMIIGFILALSLTRIPKFRNVIIAVLMVPMMISPIAVGLLWRLLIHPDLGIVNYLLDLIGIGGRAWLALPSTALATVVFIEVWQWTPFVMILLYAGLLSMPEEPFEAATIDGASSWQQFLYLTLPFLRYAIIVTLMLRIIDLLRTYDLIYILTRGGPGSLTETFSFYIYYLGFTKLNMGEAAAASYLFVIIIAIISALLFRRLKLANDEY